MNTIMQELQHDIPWTLLYADDVLLAAATREELQQYVQMWNNRLSQFGLHLNIKKTKCLRPAQAPSPYKLAMKI